jgi:adenine phosphoribosyltransferase
MEIIKKAIRDVPDFPHEGVLFKDITPVLNDPELLDKALALMWPRLNEEVAIDKIIGIESRGFIFGTPMADRRKIGFVPVRKPGKLPYKTFSETYELEYGQDALEIHEDAIEKGEKVLIVDDLLATGGSAEAVCKLVETLGGEIVGVSVLVELSFLNGREKLPGYRVESVIQF